MFHNPYPQNVDWEVSLLDDRLTSSEGICVNKSGSQRELPSEEMPCGVDGRVGASQELRVLDEGVSLRITGSPTSALTIDIRDGCSRDFDHEAELLSSRQASLLPEAQFENDHLNELEVGRAGSTDEGNTGSGLSPIKLEFREDLLHEMKNPLNEIESETNSTAETIDFSKREELEIIPFVSRLCGAGEILSPKQCDIFSDECLTKPIGKLGHVASNLDGNPESPHQLPLPNSAPANEEADGMKVKIACECLLDELLKEPVMNVTDGRSDLNGCAATSNLLAFAEKAERIDYVTKCDEKYVGEIENDSRDDRNILKDSSVYPIAKETPDDIEADVGRPGDSCGFQATYIAQTNDEIREEKPSLRSVALCQTVGLKESTNELPDGPVSWRLLSPVAHSVEDSTHWHCSSFSVDFHEEFAFAALDDRETMDDFRLPQTTQDLISDYQIRNLNENCSDLTDDQISHHSNTAEQTHSLEPGSRHLSDAVFSSTDAEDSRHGFNASRMNCAETNRCLADDYEASCVQISQVSPNISCAEVGCENAYVISREQWVTAKVADNGLPTEVVSQAGTEFVEIVQDGVESDSKLSDNSRGNTDDNDKDTMATEMTESICNAQNLPELRQNNSYGFVSDNAPTKTIENVVEITSKANDSLIKFIRGHVISDFVNSSEEIHQTFDECSADANAATSDGMRTSAAANRLLFSVNSSAAEKTGTNSSRDDRPSISVYSSTENMSAASTEIAVDETPASDVCNPSCHGDAGQAFDQELTASFHVSQMLHTRVAEADAEKIEISGVARCASLADEQEACRFEDYEVTDQACNHTPSQNEPAVACSVGMLPEVRDVSYASVENMSEVVACDDSNVGSLKGDDDKCSRVTSLPACRCLASEEVSGEMTVTNSVGAEKDAQLLDFSASSLTDDSDSKRQLSLVRVDEAERQCTAQSSQVKLSNPYDDQLPVKRYLAFGAENSLEAQSMLNVLPECTTPDILASQADARDACFSDQADDHTLADAKEMQTSDGRRQLKKCEGHSELCAMSYHGSDEPSVSGDCCVPEVSTDFVPHLDEIQDICNDDECVLLVGPEVDKNLGICEDPRLSEPPISECIKICKFEALGSHAKCDDSARSRHDTLSRSIVAIADFAASDETQESSFYETICALHENRETYELHEVPLQAGCTIQTENETEKSHRQGALQYESLTVADVDGIRYEVEAQGFACLHAAVDNNDIADITSRELKERNLNDDNAQSLMSDKVECSRPLKASANVSQASFRTPDVLLLQSDGPGDEHRAVLSKDASTAVAETLILKAPDTEGVNVVSDDSAVEAYELHGVVTACDDAASCCVGCILNTSAQYGNSYSPVDQRGGSFHSTLSKIVCNERLSDNCITVTPTESTNNRVVPHGSNAYVSVSNSFEDFRSDSLSTGLRSGDEYGNLPCCESNTMKRKTSDVRGEVLVDGFSLESSERGTDEGGLISLSNDVPVSQATESRSETNEKFCASADVQRLDDCLPNADCDQLCLYDDRISGELKIFIDLTNHYDLGVIITITDCSLRHYAKLCLKNFSMIDYRQSTIRCCCV
jgi:hypothetical protein